MKQSKRLFRCLALAAALIVACAGSVYAANYDTKGYDVEMNVSEDNVLSITETMDVDFHTESHGIYRYIPYRGDITFEYGGEVYNEQYLSKIKDIDVPGFDTDVSTENNSVLIRIGSEDKTVIGPVTYKMSYRAVVFDDRNEKLDQVYWGLLPTDTPTATEKATFKITMPKEFDASKVAFIAGRYGVADSHAVDFRVEGRTIYGETNRKLLAGEGVTLRIELPEGYFVGVANHDWMKTVMWVLIFLAPLVTLILWLIFGRDKKIVQTVEFYPPEGVPSAEVGYILDDASDDRDVISMVLYFADKGYLQIHEEQKERFRLVKLRELPADAKSYEQTMFRGLFKSGDSVYLDELKGDFYETFTAVRELLAGEFTDNKGRKIYTKGSKTARVFGLLLMLNPLLAMTILGTGYQYQNMGISLAAIPMTLAAFCGYFWMIVTYDKRDQMKASSKVGSRIGALLLTAAGLLSFLVFGAFMNLMLPAVCAVAASVVCFVFTMLMKQRTPFSIDMMGKILGFKEFIRTAELDRLKLLVEETPEYFYHILPYAYVFGLTDKWVKNFEGIAIPQPGWYYSGYNGNMFTAYYFMHSLNSCTRAMQTNITVPPVTEGGSGIGGGGGGFSGGGFSGGGMGGGGMGSW